MFTGIVEGTGLVVARKAGGAPSNGTRLIVDAGFLAEGVAIGDSVANNGCCLTVVVIEGTYLGFDLLHETEARTNLKALCTGSRINLERSLRADARLGGHFVTGHIDGTGLVRRFEQSGQDYELLIGIPAQATRYLVPKGCIAIDGISLTVMDVGTDYFSIWIIPHTRAITALAEREVGSQVNLEYDLIAKYTEKILAARSSTV